MSGDAQKSSESDAARPAPYRAVPLSRHRAVMCDVLAASHRIPRFAVDRLVDLSKVSELRAACPRRIAWSTLFIKAYAMVSAANPVLRRVFVAWPWPRLVELADTVGVVAINRRDDAAGEDCVCWGRFREPQSQSLVDLQLTLEYYQREPIEVAFKRQASCAILPWPLRRAILWLNMNFSHAKRAWRMGTFGMSTLASQQAWNRSHPSPLTTSLTYGPIDEQGRALVTLLADHRALDGAFVADALCQLEAQLNGPIALELAMLAGRAAA